MGKVTPSNNYSKNSSEQVDLPANNFCECCLLEKVKEKGCSVGLPPKPRKVLGGSEYQENHQHQGKLCDAIILWRNNKDGASVAVVELKSGGFSAADVIEQLQAGAAVAEGIVVFDGAIAFAPLLFKRTGVHAIERKVLSRARVRFRGKNHSIQTMNCSDGVREAAPWNT